MEAFSASSLDLNGAAGFGGDDGARESTVAQRAEQPGRLRRALGFLRRQLFWAVVGTLVACLIGGLAYLQTWPPLAIVQSGSMVPTIQIGDAVVLKRLDGPPRVGEIVVVHVPDAARSRYGYPPVITHRIVRISHGMITTKGDALKVDDPFTTPVNTVTEGVVAIIPNAGRVYGFFTSTWGMLWLVIGAVMLVGLPLLDRRREREDEERGTIVSLQSQLETLTNELSGRHELPATSGPAGGSSRAVETELRALVAQAATTQQTLAGATAALQEQQQRFARGLGAPDLDNAAPAPVAPTAAATGAAGAGAVAEAPPAPSVSWSWAIVAAAAAVVGCRLRTRRPVSAAAWAWPSTRPAPPAEPPLKPLTEVLSNEAINRLNSSEAMASLRSGEAIARLGSRVRRPGSGPAASE